MEMVEMDLEMDIEVIKEKEKEKRKRKRITLIKFNNSYLIGNQKKSIIFEVVHPNIASRYIG